MFSSSSINSIEVRPNTLVRVSGDIGERPPIPPKRERSAAPCSLSNRLIVSLRFFKQVFKISDLGVVGVMNFHSALKVKNASFYGLYLLAQYCFLFA